MPEQHIVVVSWEQRVLFGSLGLLLLAAIIKLTLGRQIDLRHSLMWLPVALAAMVLAMFPQLLAAFSSCFGFKLPSNAVMSLSILGLVFVSFLTTVALGRAKKNIRDMSQRMALLEEELRRR